MSDGCTWCGVAVEPWDGFRAYEPAGGRRAVFCRLEHVVPWAIPARTGRRGAEAEGSRTGRRAARGAAPLREDHVALVRSRGEHRIPDGFCGVAHLLEWAKAGGRSRA